MAKLSSYTLGCRLNIAETESIISKCKSNGYEIVDFGLSCNISFINTCTVTGKAGSKSRNIISRALKNTSDMVFVSGCHYKEVEKEFFDEKLIVIDNKKKAWAFDIMDSFLKGEMLEQKNLKENPFAYNKTIGFKTKAFLKIQDGCDNKCSFCIIPSTRGRAVSRDVNDILNECENLVKIGFKEIVLTGVNLTRYQFDDCNFTKLVKQILQNISPDVRLSISSLEPYGIEDEFLNLFSDYKNLVRHMHICLQSASNKVLLNMRREYLFEDYKKIIQKLKKIDKNFNISTDIMVGFPKESEDDFNLSMKAISDIEFSSIHVFPYSDRRDTLSSRLDGKIDYQIKKQRVLKALELGEKIELKYKEKFVGLKDEVLIIKGSEENDGLFAIGTSKYYLMIKIESSKLTKNEIVKVEIKNITNNDLYAIIID